MEADAASLKSRTAEKPRSQSPFRVGSWALGLIAVSFLLSSSGCRSHSWLRRSGGDPPPIAFTALPNPQEAIGAVNANTQRVQTLQTQGATISIPGAPSIGAEITLERPKKLRMRAKTALTGPELDLGSNNELFWLWAARMPEPSVFYARHDQFATSKARQMLTIEPGWLIEALGLVEIDPASVLEGPHADGNDRVKLRTTVASAGGQYTRLLMLHHRYAWVLEQHVYDERGQLVGSAFCSGHEFHTVDGVSLPKKITVQMPQGLPRLQLDIDRWAINQPLVDAATAFELPRSQLSNYPFVDMADPRFVPPGGGTPAQPASTTTTPPKAEVSRKLRGFGRW